MAAKPRINLRFRGDLLERIEKLVLRGRAKNLTTFLEDAAEEKLTRESRSTNGKPK